MILLLGLTGTTEGHRLLSRDDDPDDIELNGTALRNENDLGTYSKTFLAEGKSITKLN